MSNDPPPNIAEFVSFEDEEGFGSTIIRQFQQKPAVMTGIVGMIGAIGYGYRRYKTRGFLVSPSLFIMQLRVGAQAAVVGCITCGMVYQMVEKYLQKQKDQSKK